MPTRRSWLALLALTSACISSTTEPRTPWRPFAAGATATDVVAQLAPAAGDPGVALIVPASSRWANLSPGFMARGWALYPGDRVLFARGQFHDLPAQHPSLASVPAADAAVVRVRLDRGKRAKLANWFDAVAEVKRLDGTPAAPLDVGATLDDARRRWQVFAAAQASALTLALDEAGADTPGQPLGAEQVLDVELFVPSWQADELTVMASRHVARTSELRTFGHVGCDKYRGRELSPTPCAPHMIGGTVTTRTYAADVALVLTYDRHGALVDERSFLAHGVPGPAPVTTPTP